MDIFNEILNDSGQLALGHTKDIVTWTELNDLEDIASSLDDIYASGMRIMIITSNSQIYATGNNKYGSIGLKELDNISKITKLELNGIKPKLISSIGSAHSFIVSVDNKLYVNGKNDCG